MKKRVQDLRRLLENFLLLQSRLVLANVRDCQETGAATKHFPSILKKVHPLFLRHHLPIWRLISDWTVGKITSPGILVTGIMVFPPPCSRAEVDTLLLHHLLLFQNRLNLRRIEATCEM